MKHPPSTILEDIAILSSSIDPAFTDHFDGKGQVPQPLIHFRISADRVQIDPTA
jgi:hypothetical protein